MVDAVLSRMIKNGGRDARTDTRCENQPHVCGMIYPVFGHPYRGRDDRNGVRDVARTAQQAKLLAGPESL